MRNYDKIFRELVAKGYTTTWRPINKWRTQWSLFGIKIQQKRVKIECMVPETPPHLVTDWHTVTVF